jgi:hypothetical protein
MSSSKARKILLGSFGGENFITKFRSRREDGRELYEVIDQTTGDTRAFQFTYPDGTVETCIVRHDYSKDYQG